MCQSGELEVEDSPIHTIKGGHARKEFIKDGIFSTNQSTVPRWIRTNESAPLRLVFICSIKTNEEEL